MKNLLLLLAITFSTASYSQLTDANFQDAINTCLSTNPVDGICSGSEYGAMPDWDVSQVTDMSNAFNDRDTFNADITAWNVSNVTNMYGMFFNATSFNGNISTWDVSNVTNMRGMFYEASSFNQDIGSWNVSNVTNMFFMFYSCINFNQDLSSWNVNNVTNYTNFSLNTPNWTLPKPNFQ